MLFVTQITILAAAAAFTAAHPQGGASPIASNMFEYQNTRCSGTPAYTHESKYQRDVAVHFETQTVSVDPGLGCWVGFSEYDGTRCSVSQVNGQRLHWTIFLSSMLVLILLGGVGYSVRPRVRQHLSSGQSSRWQANALLEVVVRWLLNMRFLNDMGTLL